MDWFRLYDEIIDDPKCVTLTAQLWRHYVELMCVANRQPVRGSLPTTDHIAVHLRIPIGKARRAVAALIERGLIDENPEDGTLSIHGWDRRQRKSDDVAARVAKHRETNAARASQRPCNVTDPLPRACATETETETETEADNPPLPPLQGGDGARGDGLRPAIRVVGPDGPADVPAACTEADFARLVRLASAYFDPLGLTDQVARCVRVWGVHHAPDWIEALLAELAGMAAGGKRRISEGLGTSILARWMGEGGIPANRLVRARSDPRVGTADSPPEAARAAPAAFQRPLTDHQRKMAALRAIANAPLTEEERHGGGMGDAGDGEARDAAWIPQFSRAGHG